MAGDPSDHGAERAPRWLIAALILAVAAAAFLGFMWQRGTETSGAEVGDFLVGEAPAARDTAERVTELLLNYDADTLDDVGTELLDLSTGNFRTQYRELLPDLGPALEKANASSEGRVIDGPDISFVSATQAVSFARVVQTTRSTQTPRGRDLAYSIRLNLVKEGDDWKADSIEILAG